MTKERAVVVFPGRGSYSAAELGYLKKRHAERRPLIEEFDRVVSANGGEPSTSLDNADAFSPSRHLPGRNASNLIFACALADFHAIDRERYDIVAICGNSLGWYLTLAAGGGVSLHDGARIVDSMGALMEQQGVGGQILYPVVDGDWRPCAERETAVADALDKANDVGRAYLSIRLGGIAVLAGDEAGVKALLTALPPADDRYPFRLPKHAAFHTPLLADISTTALSRNAPGGFRSPAIPMIDGRGVAWTPHATDTEALHAYTFGAQIVETYDFSRSIETALKEFAPDKLILTGPGASLGPPIAQVLIRLNWLDIASKAAFTARQSTAPFVISMGRDDQRSLATSASA